MSSEFVHAQAAGAAPRKRPSPDWTPDKEARLRRFVEDRTLYQSAEGFRLASGRRSSFIFNLKNLYGHPEAATLVTEMLLDRLASMECEYVAGLELGAIFPISNAVQKSHETGQEIHGFFIRKQAKGHGTRNRVEGLHEGDPHEGTVVVIDDVTTTGGSLFEAVEVIRDLGFTVTQAVTIVDREEGASEYLAERGIELLPLFRKGDFLGEDVS